MRDLAIHESGETIDLAQPSREHEQLLRELRGRDTRRTMRRGELRCASHGAAMYLQIRNGAWFACHWAGSGLAAHPVAMMSVEHRVQVEYVARAADRAGLSTATEVSLPTRVRPDLVIGETTAVEVQRSRLTTTAAKARTTKAVRGGMSVSLWISGREPKYSPQWMYKVPSATAHARDWQAVPPLGSATVTSGVRRIVTEPCRPPHRTSCRETGRSWCGGWHLTHEPMRGVSLDDLAVRVASGDLVPAIVGWSVLLALASEVEKYGVAWSPPELSPETTRPGERRECQSPTRPPAPEPVRLNWSARSHWGGRCLPCVRCGRPAFLRNGRGEPEHKVCAERAVQN